MPSIDEYYKLIESYEKKEISTRAFEKYYLDLFNNQDLGLENHAYEILNELFYVVEGYTEDRELLKEDLSYYKNEAQLREAAQKALQELRALK